ncbi:hypothetical protein ACH5RR_016679 [Cinchona calisaya]|uniref:Uncharacterized protein n=1 Tax=Cinchona calisaya TaxID=153742 RepID=A0ABD3A024_9GENT
MEEGQIQTGKGGKKGLDRGSARRRWRMEKGGEKSWLSEAGKEWREGRRSDSGVGREGIGGRWEGRVVVVGWRREKQTEVVGWLEDRVAEEEKGGSIWVSWERDVAEE